MESGKGLQVYVGSVSPSMDCYQTSDGDGMGWDGSTQKLGSSLYYNKRLRQVVWVASFNSGSCGWMFRGFRSELGIAKVTWLFGTHRGFPRVRSAKERGREGGGGGERDGALWRKGKKKHGYERERVRQVLS